LRKKLKLPIVEHVMAPEVAQIEKEKELITQKLLNINASL